MEKHLASTKSIALAVADFRNIQAGATCGIFPWLCYRLCLYLSLFFQCTIQLNWEHTGRAIPPNDFHVFSGGWRPRELRMRGTHGEGGARAYNGSLGRSRQRGPGPESLVRRSGVKKVSLKLKGFQHWNVQKAAFLAFLADFRKPLEILRSRWSSFDHV